MSLFKKSKGKDKDSESKNGVIVDNSALYNKNDNIGAPLPVSHWIDDKLLLCVNPSVAEYTHTNYDKQIAIPLNTVFEWESKLFKGKGIVRAIDLPSTDKAYFKGRARKMDFTWQGQFKRRICFDKLYTGQVFSKPFTKLPGQYLISAAIKVIKSLAPSIKADINSTTPYMISPLASAAQVFQVSKPGEEIALPQEPKEDVSLLGELFENMKWTDRKAYFHEMDNLQNYYFEPGLVYTVSCYSHMISPTSYSVHMLGMKFGIAQYIPSPMQVMTVVLNANHDDSKDNTEDLDSSSNSNSNETTDSVVANGNNEIGDDTQQIETIASEELQCESKEDEHEQDPNTSDDHWDLNKNEFLFNFQVWHSKLIDELYGKQDKKHRKGSSGFKSMFGGK